jgi:tRNA pseudouridine38-40 synthase
MRNLRLDICYDGTKYKGFQRLPGNELTIQGKLEQTLSRLLNEPIEVVGSGRTDAGTHAMGQVVNFHCNSSMTCDEMLNGLRCYLPEDIGVLSLKNVSPRFHARLNAKTKTYCYTLWNSVMPCVFQRKYVYIDPAELDIAAMRIAAQAYIGTHDFSAFCANKHMKKTTVRTIESFQIHRIGNQVVFEVTGNGFLQHMVRIMVGTLLEIGKGERAMDSIPMLYGAERAQAGPAVPACGLCLMEVKY